MNDDLPAGEKALRDALAPLRAVAARAMDIPAAWPPTGMNGEILDAIRRGGLTWEPGFGPDGSLTEISLVRRPA